MRRIPVRSKFKYKWAKVDSEYYPFLFLHKWRLTDHGYTLTIIKGRYIYMHQLLIPHNRKKGVIDHINHNTLDNRKSNLRLLTNHQNLMWSKRFTRLDKGVSWHSMSRKWRARIHVKGKSEIYLGIFKKKKDAVKAIRNFKRRAK